MTKGSGVGLGFDAELDSGVGFASSVGLGSNIGAGADVWLCWGRVLGSQPANKVMHPTITKRRFRARRTRYWVFCIDDWLVMLNGTWIWVTITFLSDKLIGHRRTGLVALYFTLLFHF